MNVSELRAKAEKDTYLLYSWMSDDMLALLDRLQEAEEVATMFDWQYRNWQHFEAMEAHKTFVAYREKYQESMSEHTIHDTDYDKVISSNFRSLEQKLAEKDAQIAVLVEALRQLGSHEPFCELSMLGFGTCHCALSKALTPDLTALAADYRDALALRRRVRERKVFLQLQLGQPELHPATSRRYDSELGLIDGLLRGDGQL